MRVAARAPARNGRRCCGAVIGLGLGAQHLLHDLRAGSRSSPTRSRMWLKVAGWITWPSANSIPKVFEIILQRDQLLAARRLVDAVHHRRLLRLQRLGRGDVGGDHVILDQPVRVEPLARRDRQDAALLVEHHAPFGQVSSSGCALVRAPCKQRAPSMPRAGWKRRLRPARVGDRRRLRRRSPPAHPHRRCSPRSGPRARVKRHAFSCPVLADAADGTPAPRDPRPPSASRCRRDSFSGSIGTTRSGK